MHKKYIGKNRAENLKWLTDVWLKVGPPVCFLQGFAGVGKTDLARDFRELAERQGNWQHAVINEVADRANPSVLESLMELSVVLSQQGMPEMEQVLFEETHPNLAHALEKALKRPVVIIFDEAQRFFRADSGVPLPELNGILAFLRNRPQLPGRLLLLSDRIVEEARWSEWIPKRTLTKLEPDEALEALEAKLEEAESDVEISPEQKAEVVRYLDFNPRAIGSLVGALRYDTLDEIVGSNPGLWAVQDREVSREFLRALERDLLERTMRHLDESHQQKLWRLAVHRRSFKREALERLCGNDDEARELRSILVTRFLLNFHKGSGALSLNPIVRDICFTHLRDEPVKCRQAHSDAADYHLRHFKAKQMVGTHAKLGESFAELRYHLVQARREDELQNIGHRFTDHIKREIKATAHIPKDREELEERIGVLTVLIADGGAKGLEYHLARCLQARGGPGDIQQAALHADRALGPEAPVAAWHMLADLKRQAEGAHAAVEVIRRGLRALSEPGLAAPLYLLGGEILAGAGKVDKAVALLKDGIKVIPPRKSLSSLYQALGEALCRAGKPGEAIAVLREGLRRVPEHFGRAKLAEGVLLLCVGAGDSIQLAKIIAASDRKAPLSQHQIAFGKVLQFQVSGQWAAAAELARTSRREFPWDMALAGQEAFSLLAIGNADGALGALTSYPNFSFERGGPVAWLTAFIHLRRGAPDQAEKALAAFLGRSVDRSQELNERFLLRLWDEQEASPESHRLCFHLPLMPASLTGLTRTVHRISFAPPVLPVHITPKEAGNTVPVPCVQAVTPEIYVSYAWGEDSTEAGLKREEVVNRLCEAVRLSKREIGRDKERMRRGDSIERFAQEISKAKRIIAVISEKSLHSDFCMAHELFRAYRRCDYQRGEFQEKVIALVMDDAKPLLKDELALVDLAEHWKNKYQTLYKKLESIDPQRRNHDTWVFVDLMEEMVPRLPGMLRALTDTLMARGFEDIVRDGFQELIHRLPPT
ncbi:MAG TPA: TIR domain-containing protein [Thermoanaerobaculia bacterium]|jgi:tetratricopeptide (TPR) repeat protein|nr:TIR domain-containing protein [Thermoanaerobaculia bacterium]